MIIEEFKCVFIHIPRTGGSSIERSFRNPPGLGKAKHCYPHEIISFPKDFFKFTIVRNPWDRLLSYYRWRMKASCLHVPENERELGNKSFKTWLNFIREQREALESNNDETALDKDFNAAIIDQHQYVFNNDLVNMDYVGRYETLQRDYDNVCEIIGAPKKVLGRFLCTSNNSSSHFTKSYDDETRRIVADLYRKDIEYFNYNFS